MTDTVQRLALVTGANRGIGEAIARGLAARGFEVVVGARSLPDGTSVAASIAGPAWAVALDVTSEQSVTAALGTILDRRGRIDVLVNNAGGHYDIGVVPSAVSDDDVRDAMEVNLIGPWRLCRAVLGTMRTQRYGRIVNVSSGSGTFTSTWAQAPAYGVSKAALNMFTLQLAKELAGSGILVNACSPGWVRTRMGGSAAEMTPEQGADTPIWLATLDDDGPTGGMFADRAPHGW